jgi:hypothetical protein
MLPKLHDPRRNQVAPFGTFSYSIADFEGQGVGLEAQVEEREEGNAAVIEVEKADLDAVEVIGLFYDSQLHAEN